MFFNQYIIIMIPQKSIYTLSPSGNSPLEARASSSLKKDDFDEKALSRDFNRLSLVPAVKPHRVIKDPFVKIKDPFVDKISQLFPLIFDFLLPNFSLTSNAKQEFQAKDFINLCKSTKFLSQYGRAYQLAVQRLPCDIAQFLKYSQACLPPLPESSIPKALYDLLRRRIQILDLRGFSPALVGSKEWLAVDEVVKVFSNVQKIHLFPCTVFDSAMGQKISRFPVRVLDLMFCGKRNLAGLKELPHLTHITNNSFLIHDTVDRTSDELSQSILSVPKLESGYDLRTLINGAAFTEEGIEQLCASCPQLETLEIGIPQTFKLESLQHFKKLVHLKQLVIHDITKEQLCALLPFVPGLQMLAFASGGLKPMVGVLEHIAYHLLNLEKLHYHSDVTGEDIIRLSRLRITLNTLEIRVQKGQTKNVLDELTALDGLKKIKIAIADKDFESRVQIAKLGNLSNLTVLNIDFWGNSSFEKALSGLKQRLPQCRILLNDEEIQPITSARNETAVFCLSSSSKNEQASGPADFLVALLRENNALVSDILCLTSANFEAMPWNLRKCLKSIGSTISSIGLSQLTLSQDNLRTLCIYFPKLKSLRLENVTLNPQTLKAIYRLNGLEVLEFVGCDGITSEVIEKIKFGLSRTRVSTSPLGGDDAATGSIAKTVGTIMHRRMKSLNRVTDDMLKSLNQMCDVVPNVRFSQYAIRWRHLATISQRFRNLGILKFEMVNFVPGDLKGVANVKKLKQLEFRSCAGITDSVVKEIVECCPDLESLSFIKATITDRALQYISDTCKNLKKLDVSVTLITDSGLIGCATSLYKTLTVIDVSDCPHITKEKLETLQKVMPRLQIRTTHKQ